MDRYRSWMVIKRRIPEAICWRSVNHHGSDAMAVWMLPPHHTIAQPVILFDWKTLEPIAEGFL